MAIDQSTESQDSAPQNSGLYDTPPPELVERAEHARKELETLGATVRFEAKWWGFEVHLNQAAVDAYLEIKDLLADILGEALKEPLSTLVTLAAMAQKVWVQAVSRGYGCKLVSPWISPTMLIPIGINPSEDPNLWWTVFGRSADTGHFQWNEDTMFPAHASAANPAAAVFNGRLILVHRGFDDQQLWWTSFDPDNGWSVDTEFGAHSSAAGPALAVYDGKLHCVHRGHGSDTKLWHTTFDGRGWSADRPLGAHSSSVGPALAVYDGKLHCVHKGATSDSTLWHTTFTSAGGWAQDTPLPGHSTASNPALAVYGSTLHMVHRGSGADTSLWHTTYTSAGGWGSDNKFRAHSSLEGPGLAVFDNRLYCVHRGHGNGDQNLWWTSYKPGSGPWTDDQKFPGHTSGAGPAVVVYRDKNGTQDQLMVIHRGYGNRAAGTDSAEVQAQIAAEEDAS
ncbi:hypothetical protein QNO07_05275 [Streptomyces sp. 549]|uniref:hypothetical protein n=1 Tax=Streptomyces sp. 549 TaxID=3049076 RepID=UPI0024C41926|nr:hypothetical protein [Streptomyces sp. 549]MDK1472846.1 hypothetical protein [Streptomyces sp. 549]